ncbi:MAG: hypothetical protein WCG27_04855, partial [Pseudomonadota bacterium]
MFSGVNSTNAFSYVTQMNAKRFAYLNSSASPTGTATNTAVADDWTSYIENLRQEGKELEESVNEAYLMARYPNTPGTAEIKENIDRFFGGLNDKLMGFKCTFDWWISLNFKPEQKLEWDFTGEIFEAYWDQVKKIFAIKIALGGRIFPGDEVPYSLIISENQLKQFKEKMPQLALTVRKVQGQEGWLVSMSPSYFQGLAVGQEFLEGSQDNYLRALKYLVQDKLQHNYLETLDSEGAEQYLSAEQEKELTPFGNQVNGTLRIRWEEEQRNMRELYLKEAVLKNMPAGDPPTTEIPVDKYKEYLDTLINGSTETLRKIELMDDKLIVELSKPLLDKTALSARGLQGQKNVLRFHEQRTYKQNLSEVIANRNMVVDLLDNPQTLAEELRSIFFMGHMLSVLTGLQLTEQYTFKNKAAIDELIKARVEKREKEENIAPFLAVAKKVMEEVGNAKKNRYTDELIKAGILANKYKSEEYRKDEGRYASVNMKALGAVYGKKFEKNNFSKALMAVVSLLVNAQSYKQAQQFYYAVLTAVGPNSMLPGKYSISSDILKKILENLPKDQAKDFSDLISVVGPAFRLDDPNIKVLRLMDLDLKESLCNEYFDVLAEEQISDFPVLDEEVEGVKLYKHLAENNAQNKNRALAALSQAKIKIRAKIVADLHKVARAQQVEEFRQIIRRSKAVEQM